MHGPLWNADVDRSDLKRSAVCGFGLKDLGFKRFGVWDVGIGIWGLRSAVCGFGLMGFRVRGLGCRRDWGLGFGV